MDKVYITGHRNPDTDSIVSAMAYAALKNALGQRQYCAARLGQISDETKAVLDKFGAQPPELINNVRTQVRDLDFDTPVSYTHLDVYKRQTWNTPAMAFSMVDLPAPLPPITVTKSPSFSVRFRWFKATLALMVLGLNNHAFL